MCSWTGSFTGLAHVGSKWAVCGPRCKISLTSHIKHNHDHDGFWFFFKSPAIQVWWRRKLSIKPKWLLEELQFLALSHWIYFDSARGCCLVQTFTLLRETGNEIKNHCATWLMFAEKEHNFFACFKLGVGGNLISFFYFCLEGVRVSMCMCGCVLACVQVCICLVVDAAQRD